jgi:hypothetical protein
MVIQELTGRLLANGPPPSPQTNCAKENSMKSNFPSPLTARSIPVGDCRHATDVGRRIG